MPEEKAEAVEERALEFCIACPMKRKNMPVRGTCLEMEDVGFFNDTMLKTGHYFSMANEEVRQIGEVAVLPAVGTPGVITKAFRFEGKCKYFRGVRHGPKSATIQAVLCAYQRKG
jgi:hypothetical protein